MSDDRFLFIKNCMEKWDVIQEFVKTYSTYFERILLIQNLDDNVVGLHLEFDDNEYDDFIRHIYKQKGSMYYPEKLEWIPVSEEEWTNGIIPDREPTYIEGLVFDRYGHDWSDDEVQAYRKQYKGYIIKDYKKYRESLNRKDLLVLTENEIEEIDPIIVKFPYYKNK